MFARMALRYWLTIFPRTCTQLRRRRACAALIADPALRRCALEALAKRSNMEGAAAFAAVLPGPRRGAVVRALVAFQALYNYLDTISEQPSARSARDARPLFEALIVAVDVGAAHRDYYACLPQCETGDDGGYLRELVDTCRCALAELPAYEAVAERLRVRAGGIVDFLTYGSAGERELERWARTLPLARCGWDGALHWWEAASADGSSLAVLALIAAAGSAPRKLADVAALDAAYYLWIGVLNSLLDSVVDRAEDAAGGQLSLVGCYRDRHEAAVRMRKLALRARIAARALPYGRRHDVLVAAMVCSYLSEPGARTPEVAEIVMGVRAALGGLGAPGLVFKTRHTTAAFARGLHTTAAFAPGLHPPAWGGRRRTTTPETRKPRPLYADHHARVLVGEREGSADAGAA